MPPDGVLLLVDDEFTALSTQQCIAGAVQEGVEGTQVLYPEFDGPGVGSGGILFLDHVGDIGSGTLACPVEEIPAALHDLPPGGKGSVLCGWSNLIDPENAGADCVDGDFGDDQVAIEKILVLANGADPVQGHHVAAPGEGALPESLLRKRIIVGFVVLSIRGGVRIGSILRHGEHGHGEEEEDGK